MTPATTARRPTTDVPGKAAERRLAPVDHRAARHVGAPAVTRPAARPNPATACVVGGCMRLRGHDGLHRDADGAIMEGPVRSWAMQL